MNDGEEGEGEGGTYESLFRSQKATCCCRAVRLVVRFAIAIVAPGDGFVYLLRSGFPWELGKHRAGDEH